jgi:hypothetical protein
MPEPMASDGAYDHHSDYQMHGAMSEVELVDSLAAKLIPNRERGGRAYRKRWKKIRKKGWRCTGRGSASGCWNKRKPKSFNHRPR